MYAAHRLAERYGLDQSSRGEGAARHVVIVYNSMYNMYVCRACYLISSCDFDRLLCGLQS